MVEAEGSGGAGRPVESGCGDWPSREAGKGRCAGSEAPVRLEITSRLGLLLRCPQGQGWQTVGLPQGWCTPRGKAAGAEGGLSGQGARVSAEQRAGLRGRDRQAEGGLGGHWRSCQIGSSVGGAWRQ